MKGKVNVNEKKLIEMIKNIHTLVGPQCKSRGVENGKNQIGHLIFVTYPGRFSPAIKVINLKTEEHYRYFVVNADVSKVVLKKGSKTKSGSQIDLKEGPNLEELLRIVQYVRL